VRLLYSPTCQSPGWHRLAIRTVAA